MYRVLHRFGRKDGDNIYFLPGSEGIHLAGGTVFGVPDGKQPVVAYNGKVYEDACAYAFIKNLTGKVRVYKENIYVNNSDKPHFAKKVDVSRKALIELDGKPAADVYSNELGVARGKIIDNVLVNPMGRAVGDQVFISSMMSLGPHMGIVGGGEQYNNQHVNQTMVCVVFE